MKVERPGRRDSDALWFVAPCLVGLLLLSVVPIAAAWVLALAEWDGLSWSTFRFRGAENFTAAVGDRALAKAFWNSLVYTAMNVPAQLTASLGLAVLVRQSRGRAGGWAAAYYMPRVLGGVAMLLVWAWFLNPRVGPVNGAIRGLLRVFHPHAEAWLPSWLYSPGWAKPSLVLMNLWEAGGGMLVFLAALMRMPAHLHDAAQLDGAGRWRCFRHVTLPYLGPLLLLNGVMGVIFSMQAFTQPYLLSNFQQEDSLLFFVPYLYQCAFEQHRMGYAAALAWILLAALLAFTGGLFWFARSRVHDDFEEMTA